MKWYILLTIKYEVLVEIHHSSLSLMLFDIIELPLATLPDSQHSERSS